MRRQSSVRREEQFRKIIEHIPDGVLALDLEWRVVFFNKAAARMLHRKGDDLLGKNIWQEFPEAVNKRFYHAYHEAMQKQQSLTVEDYSEVLHAWTQTAVYPSPDGISIYFHDITRERLAEIEAKESQIKYRELLDRITDGFIALDKNFCYIYANQKAGELVRRDPATLIGRNVWEEFPDAVGSYTYRSFQTAMREQRFISNTDYYAPLHLWQENHIYPSKEGLSVFIKDISEQKKLERELKEQEHKQHQQLIAASLEAQEKERTHIGRELHDNINQLLTASKLTFALAKDEPAEAVKIIDRGIGYLEKAIEEGRKLAHDLVTPSFDEERFTEELFGLVQSMLEPKAIQCRLEVADMQESRLSDRMKLTIYRIVQEQCTNISKYAKAGTVWLKLSMSPAAFDMEIRDNGRGVVKQHGKGIGLKNIDARLAPFNGMMQVQATKGVGFSLGIHLPLKTEEL